MNTIDKIVQSAFGAFLAITASNTALADASHVTPDQPGQEKCYGVVKAGKNDCNTATSSCAGSATKDNQPDAYVVVPKGLCDKLVGGHTSPK